MNDEMIEELYKLVKSFLKKWNVYSEDLLQELVFKCWERIDKYDSSKAKFSTFVYMNCKNYFLMFQQGNFQTLSLDDEVDEDLTRLDFITDKSIDPYVRYVYDNVCSELLKEYLKGAKQKDIAKKNKIPLSTCNQKIQRELTRIREAYGK